MFLIDCPNCGKRNADEFHWGGEVNPRPKDGERLSDVEWIEYLYMRDNPSGVTQEWWCHRAGCGEWFLAERHTQTNEVLKTYFHGNRERT
ncbi:MAG: sarcosine oxidase subunit delta [Candidatus Bipolaricaulia bacterium]